jgi:hypothetical protein
LLFIVLRPFGKGLRVQLPGQVYDSGDKARSGAVDGVTDRGVATIADGV